MPKLTTTGTENLRANQSIKQAASVPAGAGDGPSVGGTGSPRAQLSVIQAGMNAQPGSGPDLDGKGVSAVIHGPAGKGA